MRSIPITADKSGQSLLGGSCDGEQIVVEVAAVGEVGVHSQVKNFLGLNHRQMVGFEVGPVECEYVVCCLFL